MYSRNDEVTFTPCRAHAFFSARYLFQLQSSKETSAIRCLRWAVETSLKLDTGTFNNLLNLAQLARRDMLGHKLHLTQSKISDQKT